MDQNALQISNLSKKIRNKIILDSVSFNVKKGSVTGLIGPNGAGKTTTMKAILGLIKSRGKIQINGKEVNYLKHKELSKVGSLIENPGIYPSLTGMENLKMYGDHESITQIVNLLSMNEYINKKAKGYSLGMKQKLGIALALVNKPSLVILDEPINALDPQAIMEFRKLVKTMNSQGITFLISSHILSELEKVMTDVVILNKGKVLLSDKVENLSREGKNLEDVLTNKISGGED